MADINNLGLDPKYTVDIDFDTMPTGIGASFTEPPQPGTYQFRLPPSEALYSCFEKVNDLNQGERIAAVLKDAAVLWNITRNESYGTRFTNVIRYITRDKVELAISDMALLLKAVDSIPDGNSNAAYANALIKAGGRQFLADNTLTANCAPARDTYAHNETTGRTEIRTGIKGCGQRYRVEGYTPRGGGKPVFAIPHDQDDPSKVALRFTCTCGASLRAWPQLQGFRSVR